MGQFSNLVHQCDCVTFCQEIVARRIGEAISIEARHYLASLPAEATALGAAIRSHLGIENRLHWVLDVALREDDCRVRVGHAAENLAIL